MSLLDSIFSVKTLSDGVEFLQRKTLEFSDAFTLEDDPVNKRTKIAVSVTTLLEALDGDQLELDITPSGYTRTTDDLAPDQKHLGAHLKGIGAALLSVVSTAGSALTLAGTHASRHRYGGADELDADRLVIDFEPVNYARTLVTDITQYLVEVTSHLKGIDLKLGTLIDAQWKTVATDTYTMTAADRGMSILFTHASGCVVTVPAEATLNLGEGFTSEFIPMTTGDLTVAGDGFAVRSGGSELKSLRQHGPMLLRKMPGTNEWLLSGEKKV